LRPPQRHLGYRQARSLQPRRSLSDRTPEGCVKFVAADIPEANEMMVSIMAVIA
jgi:hypothetical protein